MRKRSLGKSLLRLPCSWSLCLVLLSLSPLNSEQPRNPSPNNHHDDSLPKGAIARLGQLRLWHEGAIRSMAFSPDARRLAVLFDPSSREEDSASSRIYLWDVATEKRLLALPFRKQLACGVLWSPNGQVLIVSDQEAILFLDANTGREVRRIGKSEQHISCIALSPNGKLLAIGCDNPRHGMISHVLLWDAHTGKSLAQLDAHRSFVEEISFSADGTRLRSRSGTKVDLPGKPIPVRGIVCEWELPSGKLLRKSESDRSRFADDPLAEFWPIVFLPDGKTYVGRDTDQSVALRDGATGRLVRRLPADPQQRFRSYDKSLFFQDPARAAVSANGCWMAWADNQDQGGNAVRVWDLKATSERRPRSGHRAAVTSLAFTPDGRTLVSGGEDWTVRVWDIEKGRERNVFTDHRVPLTAIAVSPNGKLLASGDRDNVVRLSDLVSGKLLWQREVQPRGGFLLHPAFLKTLLEA